MFRNEWVFLLDIPCNDVLEVIYESCCIKSICFFFFRKLVFLAELEKSCENPFIYLYLVAVL